MFVLMKQRILTILMKIIYVDVCYERENESTCDSENTNIYNNCRLHHKFKKNYERFAVNKNITQSSRFCDDQRNEISFVKDGTETRLKRQKNSTYIERLDYYLYYSFCIYDFEIDVTKLA